MFTYYTPGSLPGAHLRVLLDEEDVSDRAFEAGIGPDGLGFVALLAVGLDGQVLERDGDPETVLRWGQVEVMDS